MKRSAEWTWMEAFEAFLSGRGYAVAPFTIEHEDWVFASADAKEGIGAYVQKRKAHFQGR